MEQRIDLDAPEEAHKKSTPGEWGEHMKLYNRDGFRLVQEDMDCIIAAHNALPALIAELRELRARTTPEPIREKHRDGNWWLVWVPGFEHWLKCRFRHDQWMLSGPATAGLCDAPTHAVPMPPAPEEPNAEN